MLTACSASPDSIGAEELAIDLVQVATPPEVENLPFRAGEVLAWYGPTEIIVSDADEKAIFIQPVAGGTPRHFGRKGSGPGEFAVPIGVRVGTSGDLLVADGTLMRVSHFDADLRFLHSHQLPGMPFHLLDWSGSTATLAWLGPGQIVVGELDMDSGVAHPLFLPFEASPDLRAAVGSLQGPALLAAVGDRDGRILIGGGAEYAIFAFDRTGKVDHSLGRPDLQPEPRSERELAALRATFERLWPNAPEQVAIGMETVSSSPKRHFLVGSFASDNHGRLWVATERGTGIDTQLDVFSAEGAFLGTVSVRDRVKQIAIHDANLAVLVERQQGEYEGFQGVDVYRMEY